MKGTSWIEKVRSREVIRLDERELVKASRDDTGSIQDDQEYGHVIRDGKAQQKRRMKSSEEKEARRR